MKIGTIDIGTNSMRLLVADYKNNKIEIYLLPGRIRE